VRSPAKKLKREDSPAAKSGTCCSLDGVCVLVCVGVCIGLY
jgi:hypothetical protein